MEFRLLILALLITLLAATLVKVEATFEARLSWDSGPLCLFLRLKNPWFKILRTHRCASQEISLPIEALSNLTWSSLSHLLHQAHLFKQTASRFSRLLIIQRLEWKSVLGVDDAMTTALANGSLWAFKGSITSLVSRQARLGQVELMVNPDFAKKHLESRIYCIFKIRIVHIIFMTAYLMAQKFAEKKRRDSST